MPSLRTSFLNQVCYETRRVDSCRRKLCIHRSSKRMTSTGRQVWSLIVERSTSLTDAWRASVVFDPRLVSGRPVTADRDTRLLCHREARHTSSTSRITSSVSGLGARLEPSASFQSKTRVFCHLRASQEIFCRPKATPTSSVSTQSGSR